MERVEYSKKKKIIELQKCVRWGDVQYNTLTAEWNKRNDLLREHFDIRIILKGNEEEGTQDQDVTWKYKLRRSPEKGVISNGTGKKTITFKNVRVVYTLNLKNCKRKSLSSIKISRLVKRTRSKFSGEGL